jgi:hypothetical protein
VGAYYVKAYLDENGNYCAAQSNGAKLTITPALPMVTLSDKTVVYSGSEASAGPVAVHGISDLDVPTGVVSYTYYSDATCLTALAGAPKEAGTYYVKAFLAATGDYAAVTSNKATLTITPAKPGLTLANKSAVYTGFPVSIDPAVLTGVLPYDVPAGSVTYTYFTNSTLTRTTSVPRAPGTYFVLASITAYGNYGETTSEPAVLSIAVPKRPLQQVRTKTGHNVTLLTDQDTILHMNWSPVRNIVLDQKQKPGFFSAGIIDLEDKTQALTLELMPDCDKDGNALCDEAGMPIFGTRTLNLTAKFIRNLLHLGIDVLNINYGQITISIILSDIQSLPDFETADVFRLAIEHTLEEIPVGDDTGTLLVRGSSGFLYRVSALVVYEEQEQAKPLQLPNHALSVSDQP